VALFWILDASAPIWACRCIRRDQCSTSRMETSYICWRSRGLISIARVLTSHSVVWFFGSIVQKGTAPIVLTISQREQSLITATFTVARPRVVLGGLWLALVCFHLHVQYEIFQFSDILRNFSTRFSLVKKHRIISEALTLTVLYLP
jgi:hypothetical protein